MQKFRLVSLILTEEEDCRMKRAIRGAAEFMRGYGKGEKPRMVNLRRYINTQSTDQQ